MRIVLTYDVNYGHTAIKNLCAQNGFFTTLVTPNGTMRLPSTTLVGAFPNEEAAIAMFRACANQAAPGVIIEKLFAAPCELPTLDSDRAA
jgi:hypothetical protein